MKLKNNKVIVINGFTRGGTNILWNLFQSHPNVCSPIYETGEIIHTRSLKYLRGIVRYSLTKVFINNERMFRRMAIMLDNRFYKYKLMNLTIPSNSDKFENIVYQENEIKDSVLCTKSVDMEIEYNILFKKMYDDCSFVAMVRNGYALCEGWMRRRVSPKRAGYLYRTICDKMIEDGQKYNNHTIIKFESIIENPFQHATELYKFTNLNTVNLEKLRFKSKKIISTSTGHKTKFGEEGKKYWFSKEDIHLLFNPNISDLQERKLSSSDRVSFEMEAKPTLRYFGYS